MISCSWNFTHYQTIIIATFVVKEIVGLSLQRSLGNEKATSFSRGNSGRLGVIRAGTYTVNFTEITKGSQTQQ